MLQEQINASVRANHLLLYYMIIPTLKLDFKNLFVSDAIGYQKPTKEFFEGCFCRIPNFKKEETIIIGDSLSSDIRGGRSVGIKTCWFNPKKLENNTEYKADYEIASLDEIKNILQLILPYLK